MKKQYTYYVLRMLILKTRRRFIQVVSSKLVFNECHNSIDEFNKEYSLSSAQPHFSGRLQINTPLRYIIEIHFGKLKSSLGNDIVYAVYVFYVGMIIDEIMDGKCHRIKL